MTDFKKIYEQVYKENQLFDVDQPLTTNPFSKSNRRPNSIAICGGAFGDEGKGRIADELTAQLLTQSPQVILYRDNGGANAGHTVEIAEIRLALHQLGSGIFVKNATVISGKDMVIHPQDMVTEINQVKTAAQGKIPATLIIDEMAALALDTHRAFEYALKFVTRGYASSTGRGISPAYADILYRHPLRMRDLVKKKWQPVFRQHYQLYQQLISGLKLQLDEIKVSRLENEPELVGDEDVFIDRLTIAKQELQAFIKPVNQFLKKAWNGEKVAFVFEKAQAIGLDKNWAVYPDCTVSNCTYSGIHTSTEGLIHPDQIAVKAAVIKATYTSSVGSRILPSQMSGPLVDQIRQDAQEYGATTGRPRDIHYLDLPLLSYLLKVGRVEYLIPTHLDIVYPDTPIKVCVGYEKNGHLVDYRPDQEYLLDIKPVFIELPTWHRESVQLAQKPQDLPQTALQFLAFLKRALNVEILMATTGPKRNQTVKWF